MTSMSTLLGACGLTAALAISSLPASAQQIFASPDAAAKALVEAAGNPAKGTLDVLFGLGGKDLLSSGDPAVDTKRIGDFLAMAGKGSAVADAGSGHKALVFGAHGWRFPVPLQPTDGGWRFDLAAGKQAIVDRRVGVNELAAIGVCADYVAAQTEYRSQLHDGEPVLQYARRLLSTPGLNDGLYWPPASPADRSPLGDRIAGAVDDGGEGQPRSYRGYVFRILTSQGSEAPGGAFDYMVKGRLLAGFALLATPVNWGKSGVMTFLCDQQGRVWERNLGERTSRLAREITSLNPGSGWTAVNLQN